MSTYSGEEKSTMGMLIKFFVVALLLVVGLKLAFWVVGVALGIGALLLFTVVPILLVGWIVLRVVRWITRPRTNYS
jgi:hypothetical protein